MEENTLSEKTAKAAHRPLKEIDWKKADELMLAGCPGTEIAGFFGIHPDTFYKRVELEKGVGFSAYLQEKQSKGEALLRAQQYAKALGLTDKGNDTLLIWLGKTRLKQKEAQTETEINESAMKQVNSLLDKLENLQSAARKIADSKINIDVKS